MQRQAVSRFDEIYERHREDVTLYVRRSGFSLYWARMSAVPPMPGRTCSRGWTTTGNCGPLASLPGLVMSPPADFGDRRSSRVEPVEATTHETSRASCDAAAVWWSSRYSARGDLNREWVVDLTNCFLIRDPREVILSYIKKNPDLELEDLGFVQQCEIFEFVRASSASNRRATKRF